MSTSGETLTTPRRFVLGPLQRLRFADFLPAKEVGPRDRPKPLARRRVGHQPDDAAEALLVELMEGLAGVWLREIDRRMPADAATVSSVRRIMGRLVSMPRSSRR